MFLAANPIYHVGTKHIEVDVHFVRDLVASKRIAIQFLSSQNQVVDIFTRSLESAHFKLLRELCVQQCTSRLRGMITIKIVTDRIITNCNQ
jgi:hypothetical protein